ncbi:MAG: hypothetical protein RR455_12965 [Bacteroidales bacterium]
MIQIKLIDYLEQIGIDDKTEVEKAKLLCYYYFKELSENEFSMRRISEMFIHSGFCMPNISRLKDKLTKGKGKILISATKSKHTYTFVPIVLQTLDKEVGNYWNDYDTIESLSSLIDESRFCGKRNYLTRLIKQINNCYENHCYDGCAVLMRRLFEVMLILAYQKFGIEDEIRDRSGTGNIMLDGIINNAKNNSTLKLSRIKNEFDTFRKVGNFSAHNITYTAGKKDIDDIKIDYRVMLEELYNKAGLIE